MTYLTKEQIDEIEYKAHVRYSQQKESLVKTAIKLTEEAIHQQGQEVNEFKVGDTVYYLHELTNKIEAVTISEINVRNQVSIKTEKRESLVTITIYVDSEIVPDVLFATEEQAKAALKHRKRLQRWFIKSLYYSTASDG